MREVGQGIGWMFKKLKAAFLYYCHGDACPMWRCIVLEKGFVLFRSLFLLFLTISRFRDILRSELYYLFMSAPAGKRSANMMPSASHKTVSMTLTLNEMPLLSLGMVLLVAHCLLTCLSFHEIFVKGSYLSHVNILSLNAFLLYP